MINPPFEEPLAPDVAQRLIRHIYATGIVVVSDHAVERMAHHGLKMRDLEHAFRAGWVLAGEWEHGSWRYQVRTQSATVVVMFRSLAEVLVITAWGKRA